MGSAGYSSKDTYEVRISIKHNGVPEFAGTIKSGKLAALHFGQAVIEAHLKE